RLRQVALLEGGVVVAPLLRQPGHGRGRQPGRAAEELLQFGHEVPGRQPVQVKQREHLGDLRRLAAPRRKDLGGEPLAFAAGLVDAAVVHARARTSTGPAAVTRVRDGWWPLRTTKRRPAWSVSAARSAMYWLTSASSAAASIRRAS